MIHSWRLIVGILLLVGLSGCVSTEELYARYDSEIFSKSRQAWHWAVLFPYNRSDITGDQVLKLQDNLALLKAHPGYRLVLRGFTDTAASRAYNLSLSEKRTRTVARWFIRQGVAEQRIDQLWAGKDLPLIEPGGSQDEAINRRVEMLLIDNNGQPLSFTESSVDRHGLQTTATGSQGGVTE